MGIFDAASRFLQEAKKKVTSFVQPLVQKFQPKPKIVAPIQTPKPVFQTPKPVPTPFQSRPPTRSTVLTSKPKSNFDLVGASKSLFGGAIKQGIQKLPEIGKKLQTFPTIPSIPKTPIEQSTNKAVSFFRTPIDLQRKATDFAVNVPGEMIRSLGRVAETVGKGEAKSEFKKTGSLFKEKKYLEALGSRGTETALELFPPTSTLFGVGGLVKGVAKAAVKPIIKGVGKELIEKGVKEVVPLFGKKVISSLEDFDTATDIIRSGKSTVDDEIAAIDTIYKTAKKHFSPKEMKQYKKVNPPSLFKGTEVPPKLPEKPVNPPSLFKLGLKEKPAQITRAEDVMLRERLRSEVRGANAGFQAGKTVTREQLTEQFKTKITDMNQAKNDVVTYVKENLPVTERGKFITMVKNTVNQEDTAKAFVRIDRQVETYEKRTLVSSIKKDLKKMTDSPSVDVHYKQLANKMFDDVDLIRHSPEKLEELRKTKQFIDSQIAAGKSMEMPKRIFEAVEILSKKGVDDLTIRDLQALKDKLNLVENLGRFRFTSRKIEYEAEKTLKLKELVEGTQGIEKTAELKANIGEQLNFTDNFKNRLINLKNEMQRIDMAITPMDVVFDIIDGGKRYAGANFRIFKATLDRNFGSFLDDLTSTRDGFEKTKKQLNINESNFERIGVHAARVQEGGVEKLLNTGFSLDEINGLKLTPEETQMYQYMRTQMEAIKPQIDDVMREVYNQPVGKVDNYFSFMTDFKAMGESEIFQRFGGALDEFGTRTKTPEIGFTKERTLGKQAIQIDAEDIFLHHMENVHYLTNMSRNIKMLSEIATDPKYLSVAGDRGQKIVLEWLDLMARKGGMSQTNIFPILDTLRKNVGAGILGFRLSTVLIQPTALITGAAEIGGRYAAEGATRITTSKSWREFLANNIPEFRMRGGDDPAFLEFADNALLKNVQQVGMAGIKFADIFTSGGVAGGAYLKKLAELGKPLDLLNPDPQALEYASLVLRRTQSSPFFKDAPMAISKGGLSGNRSVDKALFQFQSFMLNNWSYIRHDAIRMGIQDKNPVEASRKLMWLTLATIAASGTGVVAKDILSDATSAVTGKVPDVDPEENKFTDKLFNDALGLIPFVGQIVNSINYGSLPVPAVDVIGGTIEGAGRLFGAKTDKGRLGGAVKLGEEVGTLLGVPGISQGAQIVNNIRYSITPDEAEVKQASRDKAKQKETDNERIMPIYEQVQALKKEGRDEEKQQILNNMTDDEYKIYKSIKESEQTKKINTLEKQMYPVVKQILELKTQGREEEKQAILDKMTNDEYKAYKQAKKALGYDKNWKKAVQ